jgi:hypothetical protein
MPNNHMFLDERGFVAEGPLVSGRQLGLWVQIPPPRLLLMFLNRPDGLCHFCFGDLGVTYGYFASSACHFFASSRLFVAVDDSISRSRASGRRTWPCGGIVFSRCFIDS